MSFIFRYVRNLPVSHQALQIKCKLCQLIDVVGIFAMSESTFLKNHRDTKWK